MAAITQHTAPGTPRPGYASTCPQARPRKPSQTDGLNPHLLPLLPEEHAKVPHQDHPNSASVPISQPLLVLQPPHPPGRPFFTSRPGTHSHCHILQLQAHTFDTLQMLVTLGIWSLCV
jgi:hypothetical protein